MSWALERFAREQLLSYVPHVDDDEPPYAVADAWCPPEDLALPPDLCDRVYKAVEGTTATPSGNGTYFHDPVLDDADREAVVARFARANEQWWNLDLDTWHLGVKRYVAGERHAAHHDLNAVAARRKLAGVVQLSEPDAYRGGDLVVSFAHHRVPMPRDRGTLVAFPGWTVHEVEPVEAGGRWSLCVNGWGPPLR